MNGEPIYLDNQATTRVDPRVVEEMLPWFSVDYGNANSVGHVYGERAREAVEAARGVIAGAIGARAEEIVFTSGATESNNLAIRGVATRKRRRGDHLVSVQTEHPAVLEPLSRLAASGHEVTLLEVEPHTSPTAGRLDPARVADSLRGDTCLVSAMLANNEIGVVHPMAEVARECRRQGVLLHTDATQAVGKMPVDVDQLGVDLMSFSAHKLYGPKGVGALYVRSRDPIVRLEPQIAGGGQERGRRSGTLNVPGIVGFAKAVELATAELSSEQARLAGLRNRLADRLGEAKPWRLCGPGLGEVDGQGAAVRLAGNLMIAFGGVDGEAIQMRVPGVAVSTGAACSSADPAPSHVLRALGFSQDEARSSLRLSLGRFTTEEQVDEAARLICAAVAELRRMG